MFFVLPRTLFIRRATTTLFSALITLACAWATPGQKGGIDPDPGDKGTGGRSTIQGRIFYPSGRTVDHRLKITLTSVANFEMIAYADDTGAFSFRRPSNGTYTVIVNASKDYLLKACAQHQRWRSDSPDHKGTPQQELEFERQRR